MESDWRQPQGLTSLLRARRFGPTTARMGESGDELTQGPGDDRPRWKRFADFPVIAMLIALAVFIAANALGIMLGQAMLAGYDDAWAVAARALIDLAIVLAAYKLIIARLGEKPGDELGAHRAWRDLGAGVLLGTLLFCAVVGIAALAGVYDIVGRGSLEQLPRVLITMSLVPAFVEELLFRGILFRWIEEFTGSWIALVLTSALFGLAHILNPNATWFSSFAIAVEAGLLLGGAYMLTRSLWMPIGLHAAWNFTQGFVFDVPVSGADQQGMVDARLSGPELLSGGGFGLEASVIALAIATAAGIWLILRAVRSGQVIAPWWVVRRKSRYALAPAD